MDKIVHICRPEYKPFERAKRHIHMILDIRGAGNEQVDAQWYPDDVCESDAKISDADWFRVVDLAAVHDINLYAIIVKLGFIDE